MQGATLPGPPPAASLVPEGANLSGLLRMGARIKQLQGVLSGVQRDPKEVIIDVTWTFVRAAPSTTRSPRWAGLG